MSIKDLKIGIIGLGYVGLPLAIEFGKKRPVHGYDINEERIRDLRNGIDRTLEVESECFSDAKQLSFSSDPNDLHDVTCFIVTVPTPIDEHKNPDLSPLLSASEMIGRILKAGDIVIYESTVYPGATEEVCVPVLESFSGLKFNVDFYCGYSPERINPGDKTHRLPDILKVTSGSNPDIACVVDDIYNEIITAGTFKASSIKVAEAAKVIENTQRDLNIALMNELSIIFERLNINTLDVLKAAGTKWNFLPFKPGIVGGHCIGVDPYYLTHKAQSVGYNPEIILAGRRINDDMGNYIVKQLVKKMIKKKINIQNSKVLIMGFTFKENCPDIRNTKVFDIVKELREYDISTDIVDPWCLNEEVQDIYNIELQASYHHEGYDAIIIAVAHEQFIEMSTNGIRELCKSNSVIFDLKGILPPESADMRL